MTIVYINFNHFEKRHKKLTITSRKKTDT